MEAKVLREKIRTTIEKSIIENFGSCPTIVTVSKPARLEFGEFTIPCFDMAKNFKMSPALIAQKIVTKIIDDPIIEKAEAVGPYVNLKIKNEILFGLCETILAGPPQKTPSGKKIMVEYLSPNTNKPLHLGHVRNGSLGKAIANILEEIGHEVVKANLINDRGIHICKSMLAWKNFGNGETPESAGMKGDHFVGKWYVRFENESKSNPHLKDEIQEMLIKWEEGDPETIKLWEMMNAWVYEGFEETYRKLGLEFDQYYFESKTYMLGKEIIQAGMEKGIFHKDHKGGIYFGLPTEKFGTNPDESPKKVTLLRADGTSVYITQDIGTALMKMDQHQLSSSIYVVGSEQIFHFQCLFEILAALGYQWAQECRHLSYGMVYLPDGKMKSREGKVVDADNLIQEMKERARQEIIKRDTIGLDPKEIESRAEKIGLAAIKFYLLRVSANQDIYFSPEDSISFDGTTGPYCQYAFARISSVVKRSQEINHIISNPKYSLLGNKEEIQLILNLHWFEEEVRNAGEELNPSKLTTIVFEIAKAFNQFYNRHKVVNEAEPELMTSRLALIKATGEIIRKGLNLLGIDVLEKM